MNRLLEIDPVCPEYSDDVQQPARVEPEDQKGAAGRPALSELPGRSPSDRRRAWDSVAEGYIDGYGIGAVLMMPGERVAILKRFDDYPGSFLQHCQNLEHEDAGMMRNILVLGQRDGSNDRLDLPGKNGIAPAGALRRFGLVGGADRDRTDDLLNAIQAIRICSSLFSFDSGPVLLVLCLTSLLESVTVGVNLIAIGLLLIRREESHRLRRCQRIADVFEAIEWSCSSQVSEDSPELHLFRAHLQAMSPRCSFGPSAPRAERVENARME